MVLTITCTLILSRLLVCVCVCVLDCDSREGSEPPWTEDRLTATRAASQAGAVF